MEFADKSVRPDRTIVLEHGKPLVFGKEQNRGIRLNGTTPEIVELGEGVTTDDLLVHDETREDPAVAGILARMLWPEFPVPIGVIRAVQRATYDDLMQGQVDEAVSRLGGGDLQALYAEGGTWTVD
jgi:2-oxoglutarate ferredoxin oxidoreductase subunit beta